MAQVKLGQPQKRIWLDPTGRLQIEQSSNPVGTPSEKHLQAHGGQESSQILTSARKETAASEIEQRSGGDRSFVEGRPVCSLSNPAPRRSRFGCASVRTSARNVGTPLGPTTGSGRLISPGAFVARPSAEKCGRRSIFCDM